MSKVQRDDVQRTPLRLLSHLLCLEVRQLRIYLAGESATCTFTNKAESRIRICDAVKAADPCMIGTDGRIDAARRRIEGMGGGFSFAGTATEIMLPCWRALEDEEPEGMEDTPAPV